jgi:thiaminase
VWRSSTGTWMAAKKRATMPDFTFSLDEDQVRVWERFAELKGCSLEDLVRVMVPGMTDHFILHLANPAMADQVEEAVLAVLPEETQLRIRLSQQARGRYQKQREREMEREG